MLFFTGNNIRNAGLGYITGNESLRFKRSDSSWWSRMQLTLAKDDISNGLITRRKDGSNRLALRNR